MDKKFLYVCPKLIEKIDDTREIYFKTCSALKSSTQKITCTPKAKTNISKIEELTASLELIENRLVWLIVALKLCRKDLYNIISEHIKDPTARDVVYLRYAYDKAFTCISADLKISKRRAYHLHAAALQQLRIKN